MIDFDKIFSQNAFNSIKKEHLNLFKDFAKKIEGKNLNECMFDIMEFFNNFPKEAELSPNEKIEIIKCIMQSLDNSERKKFISILEIIENLS